MFDHQPAQGCRLMRADLAGGDLLGQAGGDLGDLILYGYARRLGGTVGSADDVAQTGHQADDSPVS
ncbi:hypothetical protein [Acrocarpospora macrocephala]|uniref:hypothetical protein n=1 Tax=Acrocarpospora macrocephala TaxID=150177 RepID=UPI0012D2A1D1|nr:hypothetical protein [Acrocarpospora macrocephala]